MVDTLSLPVKRYCFYIDCFILSLMVGDLDGARVYGSDADYWLNQISEYKVPFLEADNGIRSGNSGTPKATR